MSYVGVGRRFVAVFIDSILLLIMSGPFAEIHHGAGYWRIGWSGRQLFWPGLIAIVVLRRPGGHRRRDDRQVRDGHPRREPGRHEARLVGLRRAERRADRGRVPLRPAVPRGRHLGVGFPHAATAGRSLGEHRGRHQGVDRDAERRSVTPGRAGRMATRSQPASGRRVRERSSAPAASSDAAGVALGRPGSGYHWD